MLDRDIAILYEVETKVLNQAVKRNRKRFPPDFMFQLSKEEFDLLRSQIVTSTRGGSRYLPFVFTQEGVAMLSGVINSVKAIDMHIAIMRAFVEIRKLAHREDKLSRQINQLFERIGEHDIQLTAIYDTIENLLDEKAAEQNWNDRERIGFKK